LKLDSLVIIINSDYNLEMKFIIYIWINKIYAIFTLLKAFLNLVINLFTILLSFYLIVVKATFTTLFIIISSLYSTYKSFSISTLNG